MPYTQRSIDDAYGERWGGFGYLGERLSLPPTDRRRADAAVLRVANRAGWSRERFLSFLDSRAGRHFADQATFGESTVKLADLLERHYLPWARREGAARTRPRRLLGRTGDNAARRRGRR